VKVDTAMVMAAGLGTRMRPLTDHKPKPLVEVAGKPLIEHALDKLRLAKVSRAVVNVHYLPEQVETYLADNASDLDITLSDERALLMETGGGLVQALPLIDADPFYCVNSDAIWTDGPVDGLTRLAKHWDGARMDGLLLLVPRERAFNHRGSGDFSLDAQGRPVRRGTAPSAPFVYTGIQLLSRAFLDEAPSGPFSTNILWDRAIANGRLFGLAHHGDWFDIGSPQAIAPTEAALRAPTTTNA
jgi:N-acetyl-alpha-D-muramate 1-phosphate uridylyltransferase